MCHVKICGSDSSVYCRFITRHCQQPGWVNGTQKNKSLLKIKAVTKLIVVENSSGLLPQRPLAKIFECSKIKLQAPFSAKIYAV